MRGGDFFMAIFVNRKNFQKRMKRYGQNLAIFLTAVGLLTFGGVQLLEMQEDGRSAEGGRSVSAAAEGNWGLSFQKEGEAPVGNAAPEELAKYHAYFLGNTAEKVIYLTFDAGYENGYTGKILDVLKKHEVPACFFLVGNYLETSPDLVKRMTEEGHIVGNHTMHHPDMSAIGTKEDFQKELSDLEEKYREITGKEMQKFYRPPQGKYSVSNLKMADEMGYQTIFWSLAYVDWQESNQPGKQAAFDKLIPRIHPGAIVLLHSTSKTNSEILDELIQRWKQEGYVFRPVTDLGQQKNV